MAGGVNILFVISFRGVNDCDFINFDFMNDSFIRHSERRVYNRPGETISVRPEMVYYHPLKTCTNLSVHDVKDSKLPVRDDILNRFNTAYKRLLFQEFGMTF